MKIEDQCCTLEQAKKLKELGGYINETSYEHSIDGDYEFAAFTVAELGVMLNLTVDGVLPDKLNTPEFNLWFEGSVFFCKNERQTCVPMF